MFRTRITAWTLATALCAAGGGAVADQYITIGTGGLTGVYYPTGGAICRLVNRDRKEHGFRCSVESTGGSVFNIRTIRDGDLDFGVVQADVQQDALVGAGPFTEDGAYEGLRALFSVHMEPVHLMARKGSGIEAVEDLRGKRVNIGNPGSGTRVLAERLIAYSGLSVDEFSVVEEMRSTEQSDALCDGKIDAAIWAAGLPNSSTMGATSTCDVVLIPLDGATIETLLKEHPVYARATIPGGMYPGNETPVPSWGPKATFVTSADAPDDMVRAVVSAVFENFDDFRRLHPAFSRLTREEMVTDAFSAPVHPGALRYYEEAGLR